MNLAERIWSTQQVAIFDWVANEVGNLVVRARAGTGKTTTIVEALAHALPTLRIMVCAFNKRIQTELTRRIKAKNAEAKTLHAIGLAFIVANWGRVNCNESDAVDRDRARDACGHNAPDDVIQAVKKLASLLKNMAPLTYDVEVVKDIALRYNVDWSEEAETGGWDLDTVARCAGKARDAALDRDAQGRISFDDMVFVAVANEFAKPRYDLVVVDEAQDMNASQLLLAQRIVKKDGRVVVVGDDKQAIYGFRGADSDGIDRLKTELSARELGLTVTYRCGKKIVEVAQRLVPDFTAHEGNHEGIVDSITQAGIFDAAKPGDFVLSRKNAPLMALCLGFLKRGIRARIEGRDIGKALRGIVAGLKARTVPEYLTKVQKWGEKASKRAGRIEKPEVRDAKLDEVRDQVEVLLALAEGAGNVADILTRCDTLFGETEPGTVAPHVVLSSVHKAKGLESEHVFILADTVSTRNVEEANIYYVAVTRAIKHLTWVVGEVKA